MANSRYYSSIAAVTNLQVTANPSDVSIQVASSSGFPGSFPFTLSLDYGSANEELVQVNSGGPNIFSVTRAVDGTSASTHNGGAVVRHVSSARDFTDSRTHEASTSNVHGITGSFVDTASIQTLTNKTLTAPVINNPTIGGTITATGATMTGVTLTSPAITNPAITGGGSLAGTFSGNFTVSGAVSFTGNNTTFSGGPNFTTLSALFTRDNATDPSIRVKLTVDANSRLIIQADGSLVFGGGTAAGDLIVARQSSGVLGVTGSVSATGSVTATGNLVGNDISLTMTTWTSFTPTWTGTGGATFNTNVGWYKKVGKIVFIEIYAVWSSAGSGSTGIQVNMPSVPFRDGNGTGTTRQVITGFITGVGGINFANGMIHLPFFASDTGTLSASVRGYDGSIMQASNIANGTILTIEGYYRET